MAKPAYAFIGLGHLGGQLAASLLRAGFAVTVHDRDPAAVARLVALGAAAASSPAEAAAADARSPACPRPRSARVWRTSGLPRAAHGWRCHQRRDEKIVAKAKGVETLECPVTGGVHLAAVGRITALVGGDPALYERHRAAIDAMCAKSFLMGPVGSAAVIKVIANMLAFVRLVAAGEALMLAKRGGLDLAQAYHAICASGTNFVHESQLVLNGSYDFTMDLALKDLGFALAMGKDSGAARPRHSRPRHFRGQAAYGGDAYRP